VSFIDVPETMLKVAPFNIGNRRYIGGKSLLLNAIADSIPDHIARGSFCDIFAGTGVVGAAAFSDFKSVTFNDLLYSNEVIYKGFFGKGTFSQTKLEEFRNDMSIRSTKQIRHNYFSRNFSGKYFSETSAKAIGMIRETIEANSYDFNQRERAIVLASLLYSSDRIANTVGHYEAYRKGVDDFKEFEFRPTHQWCSSLLDRPIKCPYKTVYHNQNYTNNLVGQYWRNQWR
jgi:adenine-specific DNA-methyltransferase